MVVDNKAIYGATIQELREMIEVGDFDDGSAETTNVEILDRYVEEIAARTDIDRPVSMVLDCGNGAGSIIAERALRAAGIDVTCIYCESDGTASPEQIVQYLKRAAQGASAGSTRILCDMPDSKQLWDESYWVETVG